LHTQSIFEKFTGFIRCQILHVVVAIPWTSWSSTEKKCSKQYCVFLIYTLYVQTVACNKNKKRFAQYEPTWCTILLSIYFNN